MFFEFMRPGNTGTRRCLASIISAKVREGMGSLTALSNMMR